MRLRLLDEKDEGLLRQAFSWDRTAPTWYRDMDAVFGPQTEDEFIPLLHEPDNLFVGVFAPDLTALISLSQAGGKRVAVHLWAKRGTDRDTLTLAAYQVRVQFFEQTDVHQAFMWVAKRNRHVRQLCADIGFSYTGIDMLKGRYKKSLIIWQRMSYTRPAVAVSIAA